MIFEEQVSRKPDHYPWAQEFIEAMHNGFWTDKEFSFSSDIQDFNVNLSGDEKEMIVRTLSAIGQIEVAVKKFWSKLGDNLPHPSLTDLGYVMANTEVIHNNAYERLLNVMGLEDVFEKSHCPITSLSSNIKPEVMLSWLSRLSGFAKRPVL